VGDEREDAELDDTAAGLGEPLALHTSRVPQGTLRGKVG
jgi:hypothetical protein